MSRQLEQDQEDRQRKHAMAVLRALDGGLDEAVSRAGGELLGFSVRMGYQDCLLILRAVFPAGRMVGFIGGGTVSACLVKACREAKADKLGWKKDKFAGSEIDESEK